MSVCVCVCVVPTPYRNKNKKNSTRLTYPVNTQKQKKFIREEVNQKSRPIPKIREIRRCPHGRALGELFCWPRAVHGLFLRVHGPHGPPKTVTPQNASFITFSSLFCFWGCALSSKLIYIHYRRVSLTYHFPFILLASEPSRYQPPLKAYTFS